VECPLAVTNPRWNRGFQQQQFIASGNVQNQQFTYFSITNVLDVILKIILSRDGIGTRTLMASLWKDSRTPYFVACFTAVSGSRLAQRKRSTFTNDRKLALKIADALEEAARGKRNAEMVKAFLAGIADLRARRGLHRVFDDLLRKTSGTGLEGQTVRAYVEMWLARTKGEISPTTWVYYEHKARLFLASLGSTAEQDMSAVKREDITRFRNEQGCRVAASTANQALKIVRVIFAAAETDGVISRNEARLVKKLKVGPEVGSKRRACSLPRQDS
jgi:hypothetical protein